MRDFPNYEAAAIAFIEKLKDIAPNDAIISLDVDMRMIVAAVDAALDDEPLYRVDRTHKRKKTTDPVKYVRVWSMWSKGDNNE